VHAAECRPHPNVKQARGLRHIFPSLSLHYTAVRGRTHTALRAFVVYAPTSHFRGGNLHDHAPTCVGDAVRVSGSRLLLAPARSGPVRPQRIGFPCPSCAHPGRSARARLSGTGRYGRARGIRISLVASRPRLARPRPPPPRVGRRKYSPRATCCHG
jgi:hypothetical protein